MKQIILVFLMLFAINKVSAQQISAVEMQVTGLTCSMCSQATEKSLRTLSYVSNVNPDLNKNLFVLTFKKEGAVNLDQLQKKVKDAGFSVGNLVATINFNQAKVDEQGQVGHEALPRWGWVLCGGAGDASAASTPLRPCAMP